MSSEIIFIKVRRGGCKKSVRPETFSFDIEDDSNSCPGCDGSYGQMTCLCGGKNYTLELGFQCPECKYYGTVYSGLI